MKIKTKNRTLTKRGVIWLGQTCNQKCYFCYFLNIINDPDHPLHQFMEIDKAKYICDILRDIYKNDSVDIQGGEPTIYPDIYELCNHCRNIGLKPTLITNGRILGRDGILERYIENGIDDFLVSLHGIGDSHDEAVGVKGSFEEIFKSIEKMKDLKIPFRINCTMSKPVIRTMLDVAKTAKEMGAYVVNYIAFNPFGREMGTRTNQNVPRYYEIKDLIGECVKYLEKNEIEVNIRYVPLCIKNNINILKNYYNYPQLSYDHHEWDFASWRWSGCSEQKMKGINNTTEPKGLPRNVDEYYNEESKIHARKCRYNYLDKCSNCSLKNICDGVHGDYYSLFGDSDINPIELDRDITDPKHFIKEQIKIEDS